MSKLKCPFCNQELDRDLKGECGCINEQCQKSVFMFGSPELWQELIHTRKALEIAVDALNAGKTLADIAGFKMLAKGMDEAIDKITALEQKDVK